MLSDYIIIHTFGAITAIVKLHSNAFKFNNPQPEKQKTQEQNPENTKSKTEKLRELKIMFDEKLISKEEYESGKKKILDEKE